MARPRRGLDAGLSRRLRDRPPLRAARRGPRIVEATAGRPRCAGPDPRAEHRAFLVQPRPRVSDRSVEARELADSSTPPTSARGSRHRVGYPADEESQPRKGLRRLHKPRQADGALTVRKTWVGTVCHAAVWGDAIEF